MEFRFPRFLDPRRIYQDPKRILNPTGVRGGILTDIAIEAMPGLRGTDKGFLQGLITTPGPLPVKLLTGLIFSDLRTPYASGDLFDERGNLTQMAMGAREAALKAGQEDMFPQFDSTGVRLPMSDADLKGTGSEETQAVMPSSSGPMEVSESRAAPTAPVVQKTTMSVSPQVLDGDPVVVEETTVAVDPKTAEDFLGASVGAINSEYDRLRQTDQEKALEFGRMIHREKFPQFYNS